jgi:predicted nucleic acid-binding protein
VKYLLDTNVYVEALRTEESRQRFKTSFYPLLPVTFLSATVVYELHVNAADQRTKELLVEFVTRLERADRMVTPTYDDWVQAADIVTKIWGKDRSWRSKLPLLLNDILIALSARRIGATLLTYNAKDFNLIRKYKHFALRILK